jgi:hypothetical protein
LAYRFGFGGHEKDNEVIGDGNYLSFGDYGLDTRIGRRFTRDPKFNLLPSVSPYCFSLNSPIQIIDPDGKFPILINGRVSSNSERGNWSYWNKEIRETIKTRTGFSHSQFMYVDGDKGFWDGTRRNAGIAQGKVDAVKVYERLKGSMKDGQITEQIQVISHSRGGAFANGYMQGLTEEVIKLAEKEKVGFSYGKQNIVEYSVNLAPHQSNTINYTNSTRNVNISHVGDPASGNDAKGNVINIQSISENSGGPIDQHGNGDFKTELNIVLKTLENNTDKGKLLDQIKNEYKNYDINRKDGKKSNISQGVNY